MLKLLKQGLEEEDLWLGLQWQSGGSLWATTDASLDDGWTVVATYLAKLLAVVLAYWRGSW